MTKIEILNKLEQASSDIINDIGHANPFEYMDILKTIYLQLDKIASEDDKAYITSIVDCLFNNNEVISEYVHDYEDREEFTHNNRTYNYHLMCSILAYLIVIGLKPELDTLETFDIDEATERIQEFFKIDEVVRQEGIIVIDTTNELDSDTESILQGLNYYLIRNSTPLYEVEKIITFSRSMLFVVRHMDNYALTKIEHLHYLTCGVKNNLDIIILEVGNHDYKDTEGSSQMAKTYKKGFFSDTIAFFTGPEARYDLLEFLTDSGDFDRSK